jgi:hypothetical protein
MSGGNNGRDDGYKPTPPPTPIRKPGTGAGGGGGTDGGTDPCDFVDRAPLNSPQPDVIATLNEGAILDVVLNTSGPLPVLEVHAGGRTAGALTHRNHVRIIRCIEAGRAYRAVVIGKVGGAVEVRIELA